MQENIILYDKDIREPLFSFLEQQYGKMRILEEIRITKSRADIIMVLPDGVVGIEIKSDADTYARLAGQTKDYDRYFDYNYVVVGSTHAAHIEEHVPAHWGIITVEPVDEEIDFYVLRKPHLNIKMEMEKNWSFCGGLSLCIFSSRHRCRPIKSAAKHLSGKRSSRRCLRPFCSS